jgi:hypothetical protein
MKIWDEQMKEIDEQMSNAMTNEDIRWATERKWWASKCLNE